MYAYHFYLIFEKLCRLTTNPFCNRSKSVGTPPIICNKIKCQLEMNKTFISKL